MKGTGRLRGRTARLGSRSTQQRFSARALDLRQGQPWRMTAHRFTDPGAAPMTTPTIRLAERRISHPSFRQRRKPLRVGSRAAWVPGVSAAFARKFAANPEARESFARMCDSLADSFSADLIRNHRDTGRLQVR